MIAPTETRKGTHSSAGAPNPETQGQSSKSLAKSKHESPPTHGIHAWLMSASRSCRFKAMTAQETANHLASLQYRRTVPHSEILAAVNRVFSTDTITTTTTSKAAPKPEKPAWIKTATDRIFTDWQTTEQDLVEMSDVHPQDIDQRALLECLFPAPGALVCIGSAFNRFTTAPLAAHENLSHGQFIVPCYMTAREGITADGKASCRAKSITGDRRFIVFDFDEPPSAHHPAIVRWLMGVRAPVLVLSSGGKSLHAWYATETAESDESFWKLGIMAGADPALKANHAQVVRLPMGQRDNGNMQRIIYFNPNNFPA